ncbi:MAG TPA: SBBP repeat-containing protein [Ignavibacteria bacterium]|nr:SBBP repeat-containing protein [Ignavibacteria bacterium]
MKKLLIIIFVLSYATLNAQTFEWGKVFTGKVVETAYSITSDNNGNVYFTGGFTSGKLNFENVSLTNAGMEYASEDVFVAKMNSTGNIEWAISGGGADKEQGKKIGVDKNGNVYVTGEYKGDIVFGDKKISSASKGSPDIFLLKLDKDGKILWLKSYGGKQSDEVGDMSVDPDGNIYLTGHFGKVATFGGYEYKAFSEINGDAFIVKLDEGGEVKWLKQIGGKGRGGQNSLQFGNTISVSKSKYIYAGGWFLGHVRFTDTVITSYDFDNNNRRKSIYIVKYDSEGNRYWIKEHANKNVNNSSDGKITAMDTDYSGNIIAGGYFPGAILNGTNVINSFEVPNSYNEDIWITKYDSLGNNLWFNTFGNKGADRLTSIKVAQNDNVFLTGNTSGIYDFGAVKINTGFNNFFFVKMNSGGIPLSGVYATGMGSDGVGIALQQPGKAVLLGNYLGNIFKFESVNVTGQGAAQSIFLLGFDVN